MRQTQIEAMIQLVDDRKILLIHDRVGDSGKSIFCEYFEYKGLAFEVPPFQKLEDPMVVVMAAKKKDCFLIDMPHSIPKHNLGEFYVAVESITLRAPLPLLLLYTIGWQCPDVNRHSHI
jgi:hypothetical protein